MGKCFAHADGGGEVQREGKTFPLLLFQIKILTNETIQNLRVSGLQLKLPPDRFKEGQGKMALKQNGSSDLIFWETKYFMFCLCTCLA